MISRTGICRLGTFPFVWALICVFFVACGDTKKSAKAPVDKPQASASKVKQAAKPVASKPKPISKKASEKPAKASPQQAPPKVVKSAPKPQVTEKPGATVRVGAWCLIYGSYPYQGLAKAQARVKAINQAGLGPSYVFDTREFLNLARGELVVIGAMNDEQGGIKKARKKAQKAKFNAYAKQCRSGEFDLPIIQKPSDIKPAPTLSNKVPTVTSDEPETGCWGWSHKLRAGLCMSGEEIIVNDQANGWKVGFVGQSEVKDVVLSRWSPKESAPENTRALSSSQRKQLNASISRYEVIALGEGDDLVRGDELAFASPRVRFRYSETKVEQKSAGGSWTDYTNTLEVQCGTGKFEMLHEWESTEPASATVWRCATTRPVRRQACVS